MSIEVCKLCNTFHTINLPCPEPKQAIILDDTEEVIKFEDMNWKEIRKDLELLPTKHLRYFQVIVQDIVLGRK